MKIEMDGVLDAGRIDSTHFAQIVTDHNKAAYASLLQVPSSEKAYELGASLSELIFPETVERGRGRRKNRKARLDAVLAFVADLLEANRRGHDRQVYRSLNSNSFTKETNGYRAFSEAVQALENTALVSRLKGYWKTSSMFGAVPGGFGRATRWQATPKLLTLCLAHGVTPENVSLHFRYELPPNPVILRQSSTRQGHLKFKGRSIRYPRTTHTDQIEAEVNEINALLATYEIAGAIHRGFRRGFNKGDEPTTYQWNKGGRLYSIGEDNYQTQSKKVRRGITFDGRPVVEVDIRASHLTIYHALRGVPFDANEHDPYEIAGIPREVVKSWVVMALGSARFPQRWSSEACENYASENEGRKLGKDHPVRQVGETVLIRHEVFNELELAGIDCFDLMFLESQAIIRAMLTLLREHDTPCLPVHDSLIVPQDSAKLAMEVLSIAYEAEVGSRPALRVEDGRSYGIS